MGSEQEKPAMETVRGPIRLTDLLRAQLCGPVNDQISHIQVCIPNIVEVEGCKPVCKPDLMCGPQAATCSPACRPDLMCGPQAVTCSPACRPDLMCRPQTAGCKPDLMCQPDFPCEPVPPSQRECGPSQEALPAYDEVVRDVEALKAEIAALKKKLG